MLLIRGQYVKVPISTRFGKAMARKTRKSFRLRPDQRLLAGRSLAGSSGGAGGFVSGLPAGAVLLWICRVVMGHLRFRANRGASSRTGAAKTGLAHHMHSRGLGQIGAP
ncbi:hypothetical protein StoSoilB20_30480 [Arthrobacter sp. StoSoilB20]|nr:hypothetical protein StoSoilB20_30480 [Arthrobacter sp. StoSoilB20]